MKGLAASLVSTAVLLAGCASSGAPMTAVTPLSGPRAEVATTAYSNALRCLAGHVRKQGYAPPRVAVGLITDMTGAQAGENGRRLTQGATLMAITALSEAGVRLVERYDMGVLQVEMDYARSGLVRDSAQVIREVRSGELQGADLYLIGGISEYNPNIRSRGIDGFSGGTSGKSGSLSIGAGDYVVDVALDLRLVDARSSEVLGVRSLRKQIVGREVRAGVFAFFDGTVVDIGGGQRAMEPVQTAVRTMIDQIVFEFISALYSFDTDACIGESVVAQAFAAQVVDARGRLSPNLDVAQASVATSAQKPPPFLVAGGPAPLHSSWQAGYAAPSRTGEARAHPMSAAVAPVHPNAVNPNAMLAQRTVTTVPSGHAALQQNRSPAGGGPASASLRPTAGSGAAPFPPTPSQHATPLGHAPPARQAHSSASDGPTTVLRGRH